MRKFPAKMGLFPAYFVEMIAIVKEAENKRTSRRGKPSYLSIEDRLLMTIARP